MTPPPVAGGTSATNVLRRLAEHNGYLSVYTRHKTPWQSMGFEVLALFKKRLSRTVARPRQVVG